MECRWVEVAEGREYGKVRNGEGVISCGVINLMKSKS